MATNVPRNIHISTEGNWQVRKNADILKALKEGK